MCLKQAILLKNRGQKREVEGHKLHTGPVVEFVLKLHPEIKCTGKQNTLTKQYVMRKVDAERKQNQTEWETQIMTFPTFQS